MNLAYKILSTKLKSGELVAGQQIGIQIDQTLTQDSTGTMAYLQLEAMGIEHVAVEKAVAYIDHNMLQTGFENMDDHEFIRSVAKKHGITFSKPGNGVCHQLQLENFAKPGKTLVGSEFTYTNMWCDGNDCYWGRRIRCRCSNGNRYILFTMSKCC